MHQSTKLLNCTASFAILAFGVAMACQSAAASPSGDIKHMFRQIDRQLCRSFNARGCNRAKRKSLSAASQANDTKPVDPPQTAVEAKQETVPPVHGPVPLPRLRPSTLGQQPSPGPQASAVQPIKPVPIPSLPPVPVPAPAPGVVEPPAVELAPHPMPDNTLFGEACFAELQKQGVKFERLATPVSSGACSVSDAVKVSGVMLGQDLIKFPDDPTLNCGFALRFSHWVKDQAAPIVQSRLSSKIATIGTGPGYQCRGRNGDSTAKLSEHAFGNAVDIERLRLADGEVVEVLNAVDTTNKYQPMLADLRAAGCVSFMTVLGPGANSAHASHFHFDLERRGKKGDNKLCE